MGRSRRAGPVTSAYTTDQFNDRVKGTGGMAAGGEDVFLEGAGDLTLD